jgi:hypothetical protein
MFLSTSLTAVVLTGLVSAVPAQPTFQSDYAKAMAQAAQAQKPLAVFIAHGEAGFARVVAEGKLDAEEARLLESSFVCVYVDTDTTAGKKLADAFEMKQGLVLSGKAGEKQALRHEGTIPAADMTKYLEKYSDPNRAVVTTEVGGVVAQPAPSVGTLFQSGGCPNGRCPYAR